MATASSGHVDGSWMRSYHRPIRLLMLLVISCCIASWIPTATGQSVQSFTFNTAENQPIGTIVGNITQKDLTNAIYTKLSGDSRLDVNSTTGVIYTTQILDREQQSRLIMTARVEPGPRTIFVTVYVIDINDNQPIFPNRQLAIQFSEIAPNGSTQAIDAASDPDEGGNGRISYTILNGNVDQVFALQVQHSTSNNVDFVSLMIIKPLDRERIPFYQLTIQAQDNGQPSLSDSMTVNVTVIDANDNRPVFNQSQYNGQIVENAALGTVVLQVYATDSDLGSNAEIIYSIVSQPSPSSFGINTTTGQIQVARTLDYESRQSFALTVGANNPGDGPTTTFATIQVINIIDKPPVLAFTYYHSNGAYVNEDAKINTKVIQIDITQIDSSSQYQDVVLTLTGGQGHFQLNSTDSPRNWLVVLQKLLDRESQSIYTINITAYYRNQPTLSTVKTAIIHVQDVNDNPPVFNQTNYYTSVNESVAIGTPIVTVVATDRDTNARITYSIQFSPHSNWFTINATTGLITTADRLDYDTTRKVDLAVRANDGVHQATSYVNITILDANDNPPFFKYQSYSASVSENATIGTQVVKVEAIDRDTIDNQVTYSMSQSQGSSVFSVGSSDGIIRTAQLLDRETVNNYTFYVVAQDQGGKRAQVEVRIKVLDVNDNPPIFYPLYYNIMVRDIAPIDQLICTVTATDRDQGDHAIIRYQFVPPLDNHYSLNSTTGQVTLARQLNHTQTNFTVLSIQAIDSGNLKSIQSANISISIVGQNLQPPVFDYPLYNYTVMENQQYGILVGSVHAKTTEQGTTSQLRYSISQGDPDNLFAINQTGYITTQTSLDRETTSQFTLTVIAEDSGLPPLIGQSQVYIVVDDINDNPPQFETANQRISIYENTTVGTIIYQAVAHDQDAGQNGQITYALTDHFSNTFTIDSQNGNITLMSSLDRELIQNFTLNITATDQGQNKLSSWMLLIIQVLDINDNRPVFQQSQVSINVSESSTAGTLIYHAQAIDPDLGTNSQLTYSIINSTQNSHFSINPNNGSIVIRKALDYESRSMYTLYIRTQDGGHPPHQAILTLVIHVVDENDHSPVFQQPSYTFSVSQGQPIGTLVGQVIAADKDGTMNGHVTYQFLNYNANNFTIASTSGMITTATLLNRAKQSVINITVIAQDGGTTRRNATTNVTITIGEVNNYQPVFEKRNYPVSIVEKVNIGTLITQVHATDDDTGNSGLITYAITAGNTNNTFKINATTGRIVTNGPLDAEKQQYYRLNVTAVDKGATRKMDWCTVQVNVTDIDDNIPTFTKQKITVAVKEDIPLNSILATVHAHDADVTAGSISYSIESGNVDNTFMINSSNGDIINVKPLNYELIQRYTLLVQAISHRRRRAVSADRPDVTEVTIEVINVNDNAPVFSRNTYYFGVTENSPLNSRVACVNATDKDLGRNGQIRYAIAEAAPIPGHFMINDTTGCMYTSAPIDHEDVYKYNLLVSATDLAVNASERRIALANVVIWVADQNDNAPRFIGTNNIQAVNEDERVGTTIDQIIAVDDDSRQNNNIEYKIVSGNDEGKFALDIDNGILSIAAKLDYERKTQYILNISATDKGTPRRSSYMQLTVYVVDVNDHAPTFNKTIYTASIRENIPLNTLITTVAAYDLDTGNYGKISYSIPSGIANDTFKIDSQNGQITTRKYLDREQHSQYILTVDAHDNALPSKYSSTQVVITVLDVNDNPPLFNNNSHIFYVPENFPPTKVDRIIAVDNDKDSNSRLTYSIRSGNTDHSFAINPQTGELSTTKSLNRERIPRYQLVVMAKDNGIPPLNSTTTVTVIVTDQNDHDPQFNQTRYSASIAEAASINTTVITVYATDDDSGPNQVIRYSIIGSDNVLKTFNINPVTGRIATAAKLDRESISRYNFLVNASDMSPFGIRTTIVNVDVTVTDVNDVRPTFTEVPYVVNISSSVSPQTAIATVRAVDNDAGTNAQITYSFGEATSRFSVNASTGVITTITSLADRPNYRYTLKLIATDQGNPPLNGTSYVEVNVGNFASNKPQFNPNSISTTVPENSPSNTFITKVQASNTNGNSVTYSIASGNTGNAFTINAINGEVTVADSQQLDYEVTKSFNLIIVAAINGPPIANGYLTLQINLTDVNDNQPRFQHEYYHLNIDESTRAGMAISAIVATDRDSNEFALIRYEIIAGNLGGTFGIAERSGQLYTLKDLDYEKYPSFDLILKAYDYNDTTLYSTCSVRISVIDMNDSPPLFHYVPPVNISEHTPVGTIIAFVTASDSDIRSNITYQFKANGDGNGTFSIDAFRGLITLTKQLDYEQITSYELIVQATDQVQKAQTILIVNIIDYNDNAPIFDRPSYKADLQEFSPPHQPVLTVHANDIDSGQNSRISYSIEITPTNQFYINSTTGIIYTNQTIEYNPNMPLIQMVITARDHGATSLVALAPVYIRIIDVNDKAPVFDKKKYIQHVPQNVPIGTEILQVHATDLDRSRLNSVITYSIISGNSYKLFEMNNTTGIITIVKRLDSIVKNDRLFVLTLRAQDQGKVPQSGYVTAEIYIDEANSHGPQFNSSQYNALVTLNANQTDVVIKLFATDSDHGANGQIVYSIIAGNERKLFQIQPTTGVIQLKRLLTPQDIGIYNITVLASDGASVGTRNSTALVSIMISTTPQAPAFNQSQYLGQITENSPIGTNVMAVKATSSTANKIMYLLIANPISPSDVTTFRINQRSGIISLAKQIDAEKQIKYQFFVQAEDNYVPPNRAAVPVVINIIGQDEFYPIFLQSSYQFKVTSNYTNGQVVGKVTANDPDVGRGSQVRYYFNEQVQGYLLNSITGQIILNRTGDFPEAEQTMVIKAAPTINSTQFALATVKITMTCLNCNTESTTLLIIIILSVALSISFLVIIAIIFRIKYRNKLRDKTRQGGSSIDGIQDNGGNGSQEDDHRRSPGHDNARQDGSDSGQIENGLTQVHRRSFNNDSSSSGRGSSESHLHEMDHYDEETDLPEIHRSLPADLNTVYHGSDTTNVPLTGYNPAYLEEIGNGILNNSDADLRNCLQLPSTHEFTFKGGGEFDGQDIDYSFNSMTHDSLDENDYDDDGGTSHKSTTKPSFKLDYLHNMLSKKDLLQGDFNPNVTHKFVPDYDPVTEIVDGMVFNKINTESIDEIDRKGDVKLSLNDNLPPKTESNVSLPPSVNYDQTAYQSFTADPHNSSHIMSPVPPPSANLASSISTMDNQLDLSRIRSDINPSIHSRTWQPSMQYQQYPRKPYSSRHHHHHHDRSYPSQYHHPSSRVQNPRYKDSDDELSEVSNPSSTNAGTEYYNRSLDSISHNNNTNGASSTVGIGNASVHTQSDIDSDHSMITKHDGNYPKGRYSRGMDTYDESFCESSESCLDDNFDPKDDPNLSNIPSRFHRDPYANARSSRNSHMINNVPNRSAPSSMQRPIRPYEQPSNKRLQTKVNPIETSTPVDNLHDSRIHHGQHLRSSGRQPVQIEMANIRSSQPKPPSASDIADTVEI